LNGWGWLDVIRSTALLFRVLLIEALKQDSSMQHLGNDLENFGQKLAGEEYVRSILFGSCFFIYKWRLNYCIKKRRSCFSSSNESGHFSLVARECELANLPLIYLFIFFLTWHKNWLNFFSQLI